MGAGKQFYAAAARTKQRKSEEAVSIGEVVRQLMGGRVTPRQTLFGQVADIWGRLLPSDLAEHCEIVDTSGGQLTVRVDCPSYMYELQLCSSELLGELQRQCPRARLKRIKLVV